MWVSSIIIGALVQAVMFTPAVLASRNLEKKLRVFRRSLAVTLTTLLAAGISYAVEVKVANPSFSLARGEPISPEWYRSVSEAHAATSVLLVGALMVILLIAVQAFSVVGELRRFVITQDVDLVARDQAALHAANEAASARKLATS
jgi:uncharacterized membrane protein YdbT with pleckstrin-like domain